MTEPPLTEGELIDEIAELAEVSDVLVGAWRDRDRMRETLLVVRGKLAYEDPLLIQRYIDDRLAQIGAAP